MDKNFIKVDDLFRQRLGDGEERERSGAWLNMRELLDKEMPQQKRIGAFYWRRLFSAVAALSLIGTVCVSSYELSAAFRNRTVSDVIPEVPVSVNGEPAKTLSMTQDEYQSPKDVRGVSRIEATREASNDRQTANENTAPANNGNKVSAPATAANENAIKNLNNHNSNNSALVSDNNENTAATHPITIDANVHGGDRINNRKAKAGNKTDAAKPVNRSAGNAGGANAIASNSGDNTIGATASQAPESNVKSQDHANRSHKKHDQPLAMNNTRPSLESTSKAEDDAAGEINNRNESSSHQAKHTENRDAVKQENSARNTVASKAHSKHTRAKSNTAKSEVSATTAASAAPKVSGAHGERVASKGTKQSQANLPGVGQNPANMALNSSVPSASGNKASKDAHVASNSDELHKLASENINKLAAADIATMGKAGASQTKGTTLDIPSAGADGANGGGAEHKKAADATSSLAGGHQKESAVANEQSIHDQPSSGKKMITKLVVHERRFKVADNEYELRSDTISKERIVMDMNEKSEPAAAKPNVAEEAPAAVSNKRARKRLLGNKNAGVTASTPGMAGTSTPTQRKSGTPAMGSNSGTSSALLASAGTSASGNSAGSELTPAASASAKSSPAEILPAAAAEDTKSKTSESKHKGMSMVKKLALAFNDVKTNASRTTFAPGLTAGVNSYFFGPSTLKGFQFGLTGDIIFNDSWNVMTELKYFHRVNNNTSIQDNYYSYTPVGTQYLKQLQLNSYSFSALHSLEMPVAVRYHMGNFNFYAGGNFLYAFSINTGATAMPSYNAATEYVNAPGTDDKGVLSETDFKSRFGLGYLFGFSYNLSQNFSLDLRNVQTVWDNAASTGAKSISTQLYKTPSIQLSVMYRIGGNRSKD